MSIEYTVAPEGRYGPRWRDRRPPGLPEDVRPTSAEDAALPLIRRIARAEGLGASFEYTVSHLAQTESGARFGLPARNFDARCTGDDGRSAADRYEARQLCTLVDGMRPSGEELITAWGCFQFNRDAWRGTGGPTPWMWGVAEKQEIEHPVGVYARRWRAVTTHGGDTIAAARGLRLWQRSPSAFRSYVEDGAAAGGWAAAWSRVDGDHRTVVERHLRNAGVVA